MNPSLWFFSPWTWICRVGVEVSVGPGDPRGKGRAPGWWARPAHSWTGCGSSCVDYFANIFYQFQNETPWSFRSFRELLFLHKNNTMVVLLKTMSIRVSFIRIMQTTVENKSRTIWKSRYVWDVSTTSSNSVDKLKVIKKNFNKLFCSRCYIYT